MNKATWESTKQVLGRANDPGWLEGTGQREELSRRAREEECAWAGGVGPFQEVLRAGLWNVNV